MPIPIDDLIYGQNNKSDNTDRQKMRQDQIQSAMSELLDKSGMTPLEFYNAILQANEHVYFDRINS